MPIENYSVSIVLNVFNAENLIIKFLDSLQIFQDFEFELIIVDDGSTDSTLDLIYPYCSKFNIRLEKLPHLGLVPARAHGFEVASGDILIVLDVDELIDDKDLLRKFVEPFSDPKVGAVGGSIIPLGSGWLMDAQRLDRQFRNRMRKSRTHKVVKYVMGGVSAYRNQAIKSIGGISHNPEIVEDTDLSIRLRKHGWLLVARDDIVVGHPDPGTIEHIYKKSVLQGKRIAHILFKHPKEMLNLQLILMYSPIVIFTILFFDWKLGSSLILLSLSIVLYFHRQSKVPIYIKVLSWLLLWLNGIGVAVGTFFGLFDNCFRVRFFPRFTPRVE